MDLTKPLLSPSKTNKNQPGNSAQADRIAPIPEGSGAKIPGPAAALGLPPSGNQLREPNAYVGISSPQDAVPGKVVGGVMNATRLDGFASTAGDKAYGLPKDKDNGGYPRGEGTGRLGLDSVTNALTINKRLPKEETV